MALFEKGYEQGVEEREKGTISLAPVALTHGKKTSSTEGIAAAAGGGGASPFSPHPGKRFRKNGGEKTNSRSSYVTCCIIIIAID